MNYRDKRESKISKRNEEKYASSANTALAAVALQDHLSRSLSLQDPLKKKKINHSLPVNSKQRTRLAPSSSKASSVGVSRDRRHGEKRVPSEEKDKEYVLDPKPPPLTLAQKLGLVDAPEEQLTDTDWQEVKSQSNARLDSTQPCVICKEDFGTLQQVLLSCSHVFHRTCLEAFERFSGRKTCPMCRKEQYQKRVIHEGAKHHRIKCATKIQATWRGFIVRSWYLKLRQTVPPKDPALRQKFYESKLCSITDRLVRSMEANSQSVDNLLTEINQSILNSRTIMSQVEGDHFKPISEEEWTDVQLKAVERCSSDCPICIMPLSNQGSFSANGNTTKPSHGPCKPGRLAHRPTVLLSCSHVFHATCLEAFEDFTENHTHVCPVCRSTYQKKIV